MCINNKLFFWLMVHPYQSSSTLHFPSKESDMCLLATLTSIFWNVVEGIMIKPQVVELQIVKCHRCWCCVCHVLENHLKCCYFPCGIKVRAICLDVSQSSHVDIKHLVSFSIICKNVKFCQIKSTRILTTCIAYPIQILL